MAFQERRDGENFESMMKKFKRKVKREGTLQEFRDREFYVKPTDERKKREKAAQRRTRMQQRADELQ